MSDTAENVEIEDVLASIRRLVSEEVDREIGADAAGPAPASADPVRALAEAPAPKAPVDAALVLTPALRVSETVSEAAQPAETSKTDENDAAPIDLSAFIAPAPSLEEGADEAEAVAELDVPEEREGAEAPDDILDALQDVLAEPDASEDAPVMASEAMPSETESEGASDATEQSELEDKIARLEALVGESKAEFEPESETGPPVIDWEDVDPSAPMSDIYAEPAVASEEAASLDAPQNETSTAQPDMAILSNDAHAPEVMETDAPSGQIDGVSEDAVLDEALLREIVAGLVREELRGPLGEKITRNVRNLVRREIHRALASRELD